jgi:DNA polymerase-3 subunit delta'
MLEKYKDDYKEFYSIMTNAINESKLNHAYMFEIDDNINIDEFEKDISKFLILKNNKDKNIETLIDSNNYPNIKIIKADGLWIKKEQTDNLQTEFSKKSVNSSRKVYIINNVDKLNVSAANSILKFLEEPEDNIVALLITDNIYNVLNTIVSRCQIINLCNPLCVSDDMLINVAKSLYNSDNKIDEFIKSDNSRNIINKVVEFILYLEKNKVSTLIYINKMWNEFFSTKEDILFGFEVMLIFYNDIINYRMSKKILLTEYVSVFTEFDNLSFNDISNRISLILEIKNDLYFNVNINLLMDKFIIKMEDL